MDKYIKNTEELLKNYTKYMAMIKNDVLDPKERKHIAIQLKKVNNALEVLPDRDKFIIEEYYFKKNQLKCISSIVNLEESYLSSYKKEILKEIAPIIFVAELAYEKKSEIN